MWNYEIEVKDNTRIKDVNVVFQRMNMKIIKFLFHEDAVSEVIDFVTVLGILVLSIGIIGVAGYPLLKNAQEANYIENTKQSFAVLTDNINKVMSGHAPSQNVELKLYGGMLSVIPASTRTSKINITLNKTDNSEVTFEFELGAIEATFDSAIVGYENTGAWVNYTSGATLMIAKPEFVITNDSVFIPVVTIGGTSSVGGTGLVRVVAEDKWIELNMTTDVQSIRIVVNSSYTDGWQKRFLKETNSWSVRLGSDLIMGQDFNPPVNVYIQRKLLNVVIQT